MKANMGSLDRIIRVAIALVIVGLYILQVISSSLAIILGILASIFVLTSVVSFCPLYVPFGISTCSTKIK